MAKKLQARITLVGPLSYSVGRYRFQKGKPLVTEDQELIKYLTGDPNFKVETIEVQEVKAEAAAPAKQESKPAAKPEQKPEPVESASEDEDDMEEVKAPVKAAPPSKLARKNEKPKKETAHETD